jgi:hypothetical protein
MSESLSYVLRELKNQLDQAILDADWHRMKSGEYERKILALKETLHEMKGLSNEHK